MGQEPVISVVIPTFGRPELAREAVRSVLAQVVGVPFEVLVIDDGGTPAASEGLAGIDDTRLQLHRISNGGPGRARNQGMKLARGRLLAFMDDDCVAEPGWLAAALPLFTDDVVMVQGPVAPPRRASPIQFHFMETGTHRHDLTCNLFVLRALALEVGGFDQRFLMPAGEDFDFCARVSSRGRVLVAPDARVTHALLPISWRKRRSRPQHWFSAFQLAALHPEILDTVMAVPLVGRRFQKALNAVPPVRIAASVMSMQFLQLARYARETPPQFVLEELAACMLNTVDGVRRIPRYFETYERTRREGRKKAGPVEGA